MSDSYHLLEINLLCSIMKAAERNPSLMDEVAEIVTVTDFQNTTSALIYSAMSERHQQGKPFDVIGLTEALHGKIDIAQLVELWNLDRAYAHQCVTCAETLREASEKRRITEMGTSVLNAIKNAQKRPQELYDEIQSIVAMAEPTRVQKSGYVRVTDLMVNYMDELDKLYVLRKEKGASFITGINTKKPTLNAWTNGLQKKDLIILAAPPSVGKTAFLIDLLLDSSDSEDTHGLLFSAEMSKDKPMLDRMVANRSRVEAETLKSGEIQEADWTKITMGIGMLSPRFYIDDTPGMSILHIRREARRLRKQIGPDVKLLIGVDYIQMLPNPPGMANRNEAVGFITKSLKDLAKEVNATIIAISSLSRAVAQRQDKRPMTSDLRDSGEIEFHADLIWFLYRAAYYDWKAEDQTGVELIIAKHRNGSTGTINLQFKKEFGAYLDLQR